MSGLVKWLVVEEVTVSVDGVTPAYRVATEEEMDALPAPWLVASLAFDRREDAVAALRAVQQYAFA